MKKVFLSNPNLKFGEIITSNNTNSGYNDIFEIFKSIKNNETYLASPNKTDYYLDIIFLKNNQLYMSLKGHNNLIIIVKYFINTNKIELLISVDKNSLINIWDINNNYSNIFQIKGYHPRQGLISSILASIINSNSYIIYSYNCKEYTNIYSLDKKEKLNFLGSSNTYNTYYILLWLNKKDNKYYLFELSDGIIYIYNFLENTLYNLIHLGVFNSYKIISGFIMEKNNNDYLICCNINGYFLIYDLAKYCTVYNFYFGGNNHNKKAINLSYVLPWSEKYIIVCEYYNKGFKIIDIDNFKVVTSIKGKHLGQLISAKKFIHPIYGESLLTASQDNNIILWKI